MNISQNQGYHFGGPYNEDYSIMGSILGFPYFLEATIFRPATMCSTRHHPGWRLTVDVCNFFARANGLVYG